MDQKLMIKELLKSIHINLRAPGSKESSFF